LVENIPLVRAIEASLKRIVLAMGFYGKLPKSKDSEKVCFDFRSGSAGAIPTLALATEVLTDHLDLLVMFA
jgi:hypothetical protein